MDSYDYGYQLGFRDGKTAAAWISKGKEVNHGDLLSGYDAYAIGYRAGLNA